MKAVVASIVLFLTSVAIAQDAPSDPLTGLDRTARYCRPDGLVVPDANPNGSVHNIAGIVNAEGNVLGMMPHPERCTESEMGGTDGLKLFISVFQAFAEVGA